MSETEYKQIVRIKAYNYEQRENLVVALTHAGYKTWIEIRGKYISKEYYVCFEYIHLEFPKQENDVRYD